MTNSPWIIYASSLTVVLYGSLFAAVYLPEMGVVEHGFVFVDRELLRCSVLFVSLLPLFLALLLLLERKRTWCKAFLIVVAPVSLFSLGHLLFSHFYYHDITHDLCFESLGAKSTPVGNVLIELKFNDYNTKHADYERGSVLTMQRLVFGNKLMEYKTLLTVDPDLDGHFDVLNNGKLVRYIAPSYQTCPEIIRDFESSWDSKTNQKCEHVVRR